MLRSGRFRLFLFLWSDGYHHNRVLNFVQFCFGRSHTVYQNFSLEDKFESIGFDCKMDCKLLLVLSDGLLIGKVEDESLLRRTSGFEGDLGFIGSLVVRLFGLLHRF